MNTHAARHTALVPLLTLGAALIIGVSALLTAGVNAEGVPTPSETSVATTSLAPAMAGDVQTTVVDTTPATGTAPLVAP